MQTIKYHGFAKTPPKPVIINAIVICSFDFILLITTILLNGISVVTITKCSHLKEKIAYYVVMVQSVIDLAVGFISLPLVIAFCIMQVLGVGNCISQRVLKAAIIPTILISIVSLTVMTVERYFGVLQPLKHRTMVTKATLRVPLLSGSIITCVVFISLSAFQYQLIGIFSTLYYSTFLFVVCYVYARIFMASKKQNSQLQNSGHSLVKMLDQRNFLREMKLARSCLLVVSCFFLCFTLSILFRLLECCVDRVNVYVFQMWAVSTAMLNSTLNSVIFFWKKPLLRQEAFKVLKQMRFFDSQF